MKKVCIVTLYGNYNLGNKLQQYAVQVQCLKHGIKTRALKVYDVGTSNKPQLVVKVINLLRRAKYKITEKNMFLNNHFEEFQKEHLLMEKNSVFSNENNKRLTKKYDYFLVGSDQVWNPDFGLKGDLTFLEFAKNNRISFSASIGVDKVPDELKDKYIKGLNGLNHISVRENKAKEIVKELTKREEVEVLVDPTMLLSKEEWQKVAKRPENMTEKKYILTYFLGNVSKDAKENLEKYAKENDLDIIDVMDNGNPKDWIGPAEFVYLEDHAELICTDSFHSCVFGILMETPFIVFNRVDHNKPMNSRIETLLSKFELEDRKYNGALTEEMLKCDFSKCKDILKEEIKKADKFLRKALEI